MSAPFKMFESVHGLVPSVPLGAVVTVGVRSEKGFPVYKDRWFIMSPTLVKKEYPKRNGGTFSCDARDPHPEYHSWNSRAARGRFAKDKDGQIIRDLSVMRGFLAYPTAGEIFKAKRWAPELVELGIKPPGRIPACTGNGEEASRFERIENKKAVYKDASCQDCPFYGGACKLRASLTFIPDWGRQGVDKQMPRKVMRWVTSSEQSAQNALGMMVMATRMAQGMGIPDPSLLGLPFEMKISEHTSNMIEPRKFPIVSFDVTTDIPEFFKAQKAQQRELAAGGFVAPMPILKNPDEYVEEYLELEAGDSATLSGPEDDPLEGGVDMADELPMPDVIEGDIVD